MSSSDSSFSSSFFSSSFSASAGAAAAAPPDEVAAAAPPPPPPPPPDGTEASFDEPSLIKELISLPSSSDRSLLRRSSSASTLQRFHKRGSVSISIKTSFGFS